MVLNHFKFDDIKFSSYPEEMETAFEAEEEVSKKGLQHLAKKSCSPTIPVTKDFELTATRIKEVRN